MKARRSPSNVVLAIFVIAGLSVALGSAARADEGWQERIGQELARVEGGVAQLDAKAAAGGSLVDRVRALHARLVPLETQAGIAPGAPPEAREDLEGLTQDVARLTTRWKAIVKARTPPAPEGPLPPPEPSPGLPPATKRPQGPQWPQAIEFGAKANLHHEAVGDWEREPYSHYPYGPYFYSSYFRVTGHRGVVSFSLGAKGLLREVKAARVLVVVHLQAPFATSLETAKTYEVDWVPERVIGDGAWRRWNGYDTIEVSAQGRMNAAPRPQVTNLRAEAHVLWVITKEGERVEFETPYTRRLPPPQTFPAEDLVDLLAAMPERYEGQTLALGGVTLHGETERLSLGLVGLAVTTRTGGYVTSGLKARGVTFVASTTLAARLDAAGLRAGVRHPVRLTVHVQRRGPHWTAVVRKVEFLSPDGSRVMAAISE